MWPHEARLLTPWLLELEKLPCLEEWLSQTLTQGNAIRVQVSYHSY